MIRENAIHRLLLLRHRKGNTELLNESLDMAIEALRQPERKTGHWIDMSEGFSPYECSECGAVEFKKSNYCPNCGAKMEGAEECQR